MHLRASLHPLSSLQLLAVACTCALAHAQATLSVGPGGYVQIRDAIAAANPGDRIVVQPGTYAHLVVDKEVTIEAQFAGTVAIAYDPQFAEPGCPGFLCSDDATRIQLPVPGRANLIGLDFLDNTFSTPQGSASHRVVVQQGLATFDRCTFAGKREAALSVRFGAEAILQDCLVTATGADAVGMLVAGGRVSAIDSVFVGSSQPTLVPRAAVALQLGVLHGSNLTLEGGGNGGLAMLPQGWFWLSDSTLTANGCPVGAGGIGTLDRCQLVGGAGCPGYPGDWLVGVHRPTPLRAGATFTVDYRTEPNEFVAVFASPFPRQNMSALIDTVSWLDAGGLFLADVVVADTQGNATAGWSIPSGTVGLSLWLQGVSGFTFPLHASPAVGGVVN
ncbi:MAG: hypothetical protein H6835_16525 [Planctomycetes bacterium]|nr:hypothetical protein [Planctomycetota bacterium]